MTSRGERKITAQIQPHGSVVGSDTETPWALICYRVAIKMSKYLELYRLFLVNSFLDTW